MAWNSSRAISLVFLFWRRNLPKGSPNHSTRRYKIAGYSVRIQSERPFPSPQPTLVHAAGEARRATSFGGQEGRRDAPPRRTPGDWERTAKPQCRYPIFSQAGILHYELYPTACSVQQCGPITLCAASIQHFLKNTQTGSHFRRFDKTAKYSCLRQTFATNKTFIHTLQVFWLSVDFRRSPLLTCNKRKNKSIRDIQGSVL